MKNQKYKIGDLVWHLYGDKAIQEEITGVLWRGEEIFSYTLTKSTTEIAVYFHYKEKELFASKEDLIDSL